MKKAIAAFIVLCALTIAPIVFAEGILPNCGSRIACDAGEEGCVDGYKITPCGLCDLLTLINNIVGIVVKGIIPLLAMLLIAYAGFKMLINQGNSEATNQVRQIVLGTVIGLAVIYTSYALVGLMLSSMGYVAYDKSSGALNPVTAFNWAPRCE